MGTIIIVQYLTLRFPGHLIPHDIRLHATLPPTQLPHTRLSYHSEQFHIRILVSNDPPNLPLSRALTPTLSALHPQSDASPLSTLNFLQVYQLLGGPLNYSVTNTSTTCPSPLDRSHNPYLFSYPSC